MGERVIIVQILVGDSSSSWREVDKFSHLRRNRVILCTGTVVARIQSQLAPKFSEIRFASASRTCLPIVLSLAISRVQLMQFLSDLLFGGRPLIPTLQLPFALLLVPKSWSGLDPSR